MNIYALVWLSEAQMPRSDPYFPLSHWVPMVYDCRLISGTTFVIAMACSGALPCEIPDAKDVLPVEPLETHGRGQQDL